MRAGAGAAAAGACVCFRQITLTNCAPHDVLLLDVRALPEHPHTFALFDDAGVCRSAGGGGAGGAPPGSAVRLQRHERCTVTVALDCCDGAYRRHATASRSRRAGSHACALSASLSMRPCRELRPAPAPLQRHSGRAADPPRSDAPVLVTAPLRA